MAFTDALFAGCAELDGVLAKHARRCPDICRMLRCRRALPVCDAPIESLLLTLRPHVLIDARMRKHSVPESQRGLAPVVIGLGPNFRVGENVDIAVETAYGAQLGAVIECGGTQPLEGEPRELGGHGRDRFVYAPLAGVQHTLYRIGDRVEAGTIIGTIDGVELRAPLSGWLRGLAHDGAQVEQGNKVVEVDPDGEAPRQGLGERPRRIAEGVLLAVQQLSASACCPIGHC
jgi:xanthine dehydrogenase accessory factor